MRDRHRALSGAFPFDAPVACLLRYSSAAEAGGDCLLWVDELRATTRALRVVIPAGYAEDCVHREAHMHTSRFTLLVLCLTRGILCNALHLKSSTVVRTAKTPAALRQKKPRDGPTKEEVRDWLAAEGIQLGEWYASTRFGHVVCARIVYELVASPNKSGRATGAAKLRPGRTYAVNEEGRVGERCGKGSNTPSPNVRIEVRSPLFTQASSTHLSDDEAKSIIRRQLQIDIDRKDAMLKDLPFPMCEGSTEELKEALLTRLYPWSRMEQPTGLPQMEALFDGSLSLPFAWWWLTCNPFRPMMPFAMVRRAAKRTRDDSNSDSDDT